jgi:hypothetical protein
MNVLDRLAIGLAAAAAGLTFGPAFEAAARVGPMVLVTAAVVAVVRPRGWWALPFVVTGPVVAALWNGPSLPDFRLLVDGPGQAVRLTLPLPPDLVLVPAALTGLAAAAGSALSRRRSGGLEALLPSAVVGAYGVFAAGVHSVQTLPVGLGLLAAALLVLRGRRPVAVALVLIAGLPLIWLPWRAAPDTPDPRDRLQPAARPAAGVDLIDQVGGWLAAPEEAVLFRADTNRTGAPARWRLAVLDAYDGETWRSSGKVVPAGLGVPPFRGAVPSDAVTQRVELVDLRGPYLPAADRPIRVAAPVAAVEPDTGVLVAAAEAGRGTRYEVVSRVRAPVEPAATEAAGAGDLTIPADLREAVRGFLDQTGVRPDMRPPQRAEIVARFLRTHRSNVAGTPTAATVPAIKALLADRGEGAAVQFATAFALVMRALGVPARIVVGFEASGREVHARDVRVWPEVRYAAAGWVRYDPTPPLTSAVAAARQAEEDPEPLASAEPEPSPTPTHGPSDPHPPSSLSPLLLALLTGVAAVGALVALIPWVRRAWRRRRRPTDDARVVAAWHDVLDAYHPADPRTLTPSRLHRDLIGVLPAPAAVTSRTLSGLADKALYSPEACTSQDGDLAWQSAAELRRALRLRQPGLRFPTTDASAK